MEYLEEVPMAYAQAADLVHGGTKGPWADLLPSSASFWIKEVWSSGIVQAW